MVHCLNRQVFLKLLVDKKHLLKNRYVILMQMYLFLRKSVLIRSDMESSCQLACCLIYCYIPFSCVHVVAKLSWKIVEKQPCTTVSFITFMIFKIDTSSNMWPFLFSCPLSMATGKTITYIYIYNYIICPLFNLGQYHYCDSYHSSYKTVVRTLPMHQKARPLKYTPNMKWVM